MTGKPEPADATQPVTDTDPDCWYLAGCLWPLGCDAEHKCIGKEVERKP